MSNKELIAKARAVAVRDNLKAVIARNEMIGALIEALEACEAELAALRAATDAQNAAFIREIERYREERVGIGTLVGWTPIMSKPLVLCVHEMLKRLRILAPDTKGAVAKTEEPKQ